MFPDAVESDAKILSVLLFIPHQKLLSWFDGSTRTVENLPLILECHQISLFIIMRTIHIPEEIKKRDNQGIIKDKRTTVCSKTNLIRKLNHSK